MTMTSDEADVEIEVATLSIPTWLMREYELPSRELFGRIVQTSHKAMLFEGTMNTRESTRCLRDGTALEGSERQGGYCAKCSAEIGADPSNLKPRQLWLPKKHVTIIDGSGTQPEDEGPADTSDVTITVRVNKAYIEAQADRFDEFSKADLKSIPGRRWAPRRKLWRYPATPAVAAELWSVVKKYRHNVSEGFRQLVAENEARGTAAVFKETAKEDLPAIPVTSDLDPWEHQLQGFHFGRSLDSFGFYAVMGAGKTRTAIDLLQNSEARKILIVCPRSVVGVWPREFRKWAVNPEGWMQVPLRAEKIGSVEERTEWAKAHLRQAEAHNLRCVIIINFEAVWREPFATWAQKEKWDYIVVDEAHRIKSAGSKVSQFMGRLSRRTRKRLSLTGTPMPNNPTDVFGQYRFLDPGIFGNSFVTFKNRYAILGGYKDKTLTGFRIAPMLKDGSPNPHYDPELAVEFHEKMFSIAMEVGEEVLDLPPLSEFDKPFELCPKALKVYQEMEEEKYVDLAEHGVLGDVGEILEKIELGEATEEEMLEGMKYRLHGGTESSAKNVLTMMLRLQQITGGVMRDDMGYDHVIDDGKKIILEDILEDIGDEPVVVFCLAGETKVPTRKGWVEIRHLAGSEPELLVPSKHPSEQYGPGVWRRAPVRSMGVQRLYKITLGKRGATKEIYATAEHKWYLRGLVGRPNTVMTTAELVNATPTADGNNRYTIPTVGPKSVAYQTTPSPVGICAGLVFGDGSANDHCSTLNLHGEKNMPLTRYFSLEQTRHTYLYEDRYTEPYIKIDGLPRSWKRLPRLDEGSSYLYGWLAGYFAADGRVTQKGQATLSSVNREHLEQVRVIALQLGIRTFEVQGGRRRTIIDPQDDEREQIMYDLTFDGRTLHESFFLIPEHEKRFRKLSHLYRAQEWGVISVEETDRVEEVYCATVPGVESFVIDDFMLTSNCRFKHDLRVVQAAADKMKKRYAELSGSRRDALTEDSELAENVDVAGVQIQSGGTGIDLTRARYVIYYSLTHSLGEYDQSMKRVHRPGQTRPVIVYHLVAEDTIDRDVYEAIIGKARIVDFVMRGLRNRHPEVEAAA